MTSTFRKIIPWLIAALGIAVLLFAGLVLIAPTLVNLEAVKAEIETATSREVGGTVTAGHIELSFLPRPRIMLADPKISIPGFIEGGLSSLDIQIKLLPLFRRIVQVSSLELHKPDFRFTLKSDALPARQKKTQNQVAEKKIGALLAAFTAKTSGLSTTVDHGRIEILDQDGQLLVIRDLTMTVLVPLDQAGGQSAAQDDDAGERFTITGEIDQAVVDVRALPGPVTLRLEQFTAVPDQFTFQNISARMLDGSVTATGSIPRYLTKARSLELEGYGRIGARITEWIRNRSGLPLQPVLRTPVDGKNIHVLLRPGTGASVSADIQVSGGPSIAFSLDMKPEQALLRKCRIRDAESQADISLRLGRQEIEASFQGMLARTTLDRLFMQEQTRTQWIRGSFRLHAVRSAPYVRTFEGTLEAENLMVPVKSGQPLVIRNVALQGEGDVAQITSAAVVWVDVPLDVKGSVTMQPEYAKLDLDVVAGKLNVDAIKQAIAGHPTATVPTGGNANEASVSPFPVRGEVRVAADSVSLGRFLFTPVRSSVSIARGAVRLNHTEASICGIGLTGDLEFRKKKFSVDVQAGAEDVPVEKTLACFRSSDNQMTGTFNLTADLSTEMTDNFLRSLKGPVEVTAVDGRINRMVSMAKILELVNSTEVFRGKYPGLGNEGLKYNSITLKGEMGQGVLTVHEGVMDGTTMEIAGAGTADLLQGQLDFRVAVAPLKTVDAVVKKLPILKNILGGTLIAVPLRVTGTLSKPDVKSITLAEAGQDVTGIFSKTLKAPFKFVEGLVPGEKAKRKP